MRNLHLAYRQRFSGTQLLKVMVATTCGIASPFGNPLVVKDLIEALLQHSKKPFILV